MFERADSKLDEQVASNLDLNDQYVLDMQTNSEHNIQSLKRLRSPSSSNLSNLSIIVSQYAVERFHEYDNSDNRFGMNAQLLEVFGNRRPSGYTRIRIISRIKNHVYWLMVDNKIMQSEGHYHIIQQIPKDLDNYNDKIDMLEQE